MKRSPTFIFLFVIAICCLVWPSVILGQSQEGSTPKYIVQSAEGSSFPDVQIKIRAIDGANTAISDLSKNEINVYDGQSRVSNFDLVAEAESEPTVTYFMIDMGSGSVYGTLGSTNIRNVLKLFVEGDHFRDGVDTVAIYGAVDGQGATVLLEPTKSANSYLSYLNRFQFAESGLPEGFPAVQVALGDLITEIGTEGVNGGNLVYVGGQPHNIAGYSANERLATSITSEARRSVVQISAIDSRNAYFGDEVDYTEPLKALASNSGGQYVALTKTTQERFPQLNRLYAGLIDQGQSYTISFRSEDDNPGTREIAVVPNGLSLASAERTDSIVVADGRPDIIISSPNNNTTIERKLVEDDSGNFVFDTGTASVVADLNLNDNRLIREAQLLENGVSILTVIPEEGAETITFSWDISAFNEPGQAYPRPLSVRVTDEFGNEVESATVTAVVESEDVGIAIEGGVDPNRVCEDFPDAEVCVERDALAGIVETVVPEATQVAEDLEESEQIVEDITGGGSVASVSFRYCARNFTDASCIPTFLPFLLSLGFGVTALVLYLNRNKVSEVVQNVAAEVRKTLLGGAGQRGQEVIAKLHVIAARRDLVDQAIDIYTYTTTLGRDPKLCDVQLYNEEDNSTVSGLHCTLQYDKATNQFLLTDDNSTAGTKVNNRQLRANDPYVLEDGDEIQLGDMFRQGARLRFERIKKEASSDEDFHDPLDTLLDEDLKSGTTALDEDYYAGETILEDDDDGYLPPSSGSADRLLEDDDDDNWLEELS